jgi:DNA topoisomerase VI subunit B
MLDFCSAKELVAQTGHEPGDWPLVIVKELVDNALDACEEARTAPKIAVSVDESGITVSDNGPGLPSDVVGDILDFNVRVSSREAYISPSRGAQGNAVKTLVAMPFVLGGETRTVEINACGVRHEIVFAVDAIRQQPVIQHRRSDGLVHSGTRVTVRWPAGASSLLTAARVRFVHLADDYAWLNPHVAITVSWFGKPAVAQRRMGEGWQKWRPSDPTAPHWYTTQHL